MIPIPEDFKFLLTHRELYKSTQQIMNIIN